jgi:hypothetical protein
MALTYDIGGVPSKAAVSSFLMNQANFIRSVHDQADFFWRIYAQTLATDQQKTDAGLDIVTFPGDKSRLDTFGTVMLQLKNLLEGAAPAQITDTRDFDAQIIGPS